MRQRTSPSTTAAAGGRPSRGDTAAPGRPAPAAALRSLLAGAARPHEVLALQRAMGNRSVSRAVVSSRPLRRSGPVIMRVKDFASAGVPTGTGLTKSLPGPYGSWHIHVIHDEEGLGLVKQIFLKFEELEGAQHLLLDASGAVVKLALNRTGEKDQVEWGLERLREFYAGLTEVGVEGVQQRRREKEEREKKQKEAMDKLPALKPIGFATDTRGLFGGASAMTEEDAGLRLAALGMDKSHPDFMIAKARLKTGAARDRWKGMEALYDKLFPPVVESTLPLVESVVEEKKEEEEKKEDTTADTRSEVPTTATTSATTTTRSTTEPERVPTGREVARVVREEVAHGGGLAGVGPSLLTLGVPLALVMLILALVFGAFR